MATNMAGEAATEGFEPAEVMGAIYGPGIIGRAGAFDRAWVQRLGEDVAEVYEEALARPDGAVGRGPKRHYVEMRPEDVRGFVDLVTHPWVAAVCETVLGPD